MGLEQIGPIYAATSGAVCEVRRNDKMIRDDTERQPKNRYSRLLFGLVLQPDPRGVCVRPESDEPAPGQQNPVIPRCD